ncbi:hypothetical protein D8674_022711 [Pyrus ussuriensis x Pyrus communis]|uniref:Uncharacterized protein n=1 Tax=Pyrus ussuriensis x Pyrus communis TaxID=2448454 RepID=A0A5N5GMU9_9ROSA|nr:hypothetical protein D8674_022711 [Pyrus ussuriensis x Pyrus communis]
MCPIIDADEKIKNMDTEKIKRYLFQISMRSKWEAVVRIYRLNKKAHGAIITKSGDTALHLAVSDGQEKHVKELVDLVEVKELEIQNEQGNTPLHIAAWMGNETMCSCLANAHPSLVTTFNVDNETPLFLAAVYGKKDAFLCMHYIYNPTPGEVPRTRYNYCRRNNGDIILHCAISGDHFDLAFQIIHLYKDLVNFVNAQGFSPLHLLATKPSAFKSGSHLSRFQEIIYHCIYVDELKAEQGKRSNEGIIKTFKEEENPKHPENYQTCINFLRLFRKAIRLEIKSADPENPIEPNKQTLNTSNPGHKKFPGNYNTCFEFVKLISKALLIVLGLGSTEIRKTREKKEKHKWSVQIMTELLARAVMYKYEDSGTAPPSQKEKDNDETTPYNIADGGAVLMPSDSALDVPIPQQEAQQPKNGSSADKKTENITPSVNTETPILIAARNGVTEMVDKILELFPVAIHDMNKEKKNIVLLAVEYRQPHVYMLLLKRNILKESVFSKVDHEGNSALHLAAKLGEHKPWLIPGAALQMQWEIKWYEVRIERTEIFNR